MGERKYLIANNQDEAQSRAMESTSKGKKQISPTDITYLLNDISLENKGNQAASSTIRSSSEQSRNNALSTTKSDRSKESLSSQSQLSSKSYIDAVTPFKYLASNDDVLLLTPYLHLPPPEHPSDIQMDPFQPFGKALSDYHSNVRHMPYVAKHGMLNSHERMIQDCSAVLIIVADSSASDGYHDERLDQVHDQVEFLWKVEAMTLSLRKPCLAIEVGLSKGQEGYKSARLEVAKWCELDSVPGTIFAR